ncbi:MAG: hypothetical protein HC860_27350 [Alkalinema sp. RU_4_3]|nr:hypothetical protein [Alkalinema sp. RU_4_3]
MEIDRLKELRRKLVTGKNFSEIWEFYMDNFADHEAFTDLGERAENEFIDAVLKTLCGQLFGPKARIDDFLLISIADYDFFHGPFMVEGRIGGIIYFEDVNFGMMAVSESPGSDMVKYSRFSMPMKLKVDKGAIDEN